MVPGLAAMGGDMLKFDILEMGLWIVSPLFDSVVSQLVYTSLLLINRLYFTCGESKIYSTIKKSQNMMNMIVCKIFVCF